MVALLKFNCGVYQGLGVVSGKTQGDLGLHHGDTGIFLVSLHVFSHVQRASVIHWLTEHPWESCMIPLQQWRCSLNTYENLFLTFLFLRSPAKQQERGNAYEANFCFCIIMLQILNFGGWTGNSKQRMDANYFVYM